MRQRPGFVSVFTAVSVPICSIAALAFGAGTAVANGSTMVPLSANFKRCDFSNTSGIPPATRGTGYVIITRSGNTVSAETHLFGATADISYDVRLVEMPRSGIRCGANDSGVALGPLNTDSAGNGTTTIQADVMPGADGAWVSVEGPLGESNAVSGDFRTSDYVVHI